METKKSGTISFWTTGENLTRLYRDFILEGNFEFVFREFVDQEFPKDEIKKFFLNQTKFEGDSRTDEGLCVVPDEGLTKTELFERFQTAIRTLCSNLDEDDFEEVSSIFNNNFLYLIEDEDGKIKKNLKILFALFPKKDLRKFFNREFMLHELGFEVVTNEKMESHFNGIILQDGTIIKCGFQEHRYVYPTLEKYGYSDDSGWGFDCSMTIKISDGQLNGDGSNKFLNWEMYHSDAKITKAQVEQIMKNYNVLSEYGSYKTPILDNILEYIEVENDNGGKYGKLKYLEMVYPEIKLPKFSKSPLLDIKNCIRTSPLKSISGLLTSKFDITDNSVNEILSDFEQYKDVIKGNKIHWFYQEYLEGVNGVCNYMGTEFNYSCSTNRGDIVSGKKGNHKITNSEETYLNETAKKISDDLKRNIQLEFVITDNGDIYIVQLKVMGRSEPTNYRGMKLIIKDDIITTGKSFYRTNKYGIKLKDALVIDSDCESKELIGKEVLIVRDDVQFSHALALSYSLAIPSIYAVGDVELPEIFSIDTYEDKGYLLTTKK